MCQKKTIHFHILQRGILAFRLLVTFLASLAYEQQRHESRKLKQNKIIKTKMNLTMNFVATAMATVSVDALASNARETKIVTTDKDGNTVDRTVTTTGPNGQTETHSGSVTFNQ
jgi:hypothetical protein